MQRFILKTLKEEFASVRQQYQLVNANLMRKYYFDVELI